MDGIRGWIAKKVDNLLSSHVVSPSYVRKLVKYLLIHIDAKERRRTCAID